APGTVRWRLKQALEELRRELDRRFEGGRAAWSALLAPLAGRWPIAIAPTASAVGLTFWLVTGTAAVALLLTWRFVGSSTEMERGMVADTKGPELHAESSSATPKTPQALTDAVRQSLQDDDSRTEANSHSSDETMDLAGVVLVDGGPPEFTVALTASAGTRE